MDWQSYASLKTESEMNNVITGYFERGSKRMSAHSVRGPGKTAPDVFSQTAAAMRVRAIEADVEDTLRRWTYDAGLLADDLYFITGGGEYVDAAVRRIDDIESFLFSTLAISPESFLIRERRDERRGTPLREIFAWVTDSRRPMWNSMRVHYAVIVLEYRARMRAIAEAALSVL